MPSRDAGTSIAEDSLPTSSKLSSFMDLSTPAIQSYKTNQNLAGWAQETGQVKATGAELASNKALLEDDVRLSNQSELVDWIAQDLPPDTTDTAKIVRAAQWLFEYGSLDINELKTLNSALSQFQGRNVLESLDEGMRASETFSERHSHERLIQVFATLAAASEHMSTAA